jgi:hypothetical protein
MADEIPAMALALGAGGKPIVRIGEAEYDDLAALIAAVPVLAAPEALPLQVRVANHMAAGFRFEPIDDPAAFRAAYMAEYEAEDPEEEPVPGNPRLHNYGLPDFAEITPPGTQGDRIVFYARNTFLGIPYRAEMVPGGMPDYQPVAMG